MIASPSRNGHAPHTSAPPLGPRFTVPSPNGADGASVAVPPSANGGNGPEPAGGSPSANGADGRDRRGRFAKGNKGGPGNPFARRVARLRTLLLEVVTEDDLRGVLAKLVERARAGDLAAVRLLLHYLIGRPVDAVDPDRLDLEEWRLYQQGPTLAEVFDSPPPGQPHHLDPALACVLTRACQEQNLDRLLDLTTQRLGAAKG